MALKLLIYNACPSKLSSEAAQFRNEDRIKIPVRSVRTVANHTTQITSKSSLHRITQTTAAIEHRS
jgi:hypothetical protein